MAPLFWGMGNLCQRDCFVDCEGNSPYGILAEPVNGLLVVAQYIEEEGRHPGPFHALLVEHLLLDEYFLFHIGGQPASLEDEKSRNACRDGISEHNACTSEIGPVIPFGIWIGHPDAEAPCEQRGEIDDERNKYVDSDIKICHFVSSWATGVSLFYLYALVVVIH